MELETIITKDKEQFLSDPGRYNKEIQWVKKIIF